MYASFRQASILVANGYIYELSPGRYAERGSEAKVWRPKASDGMRVMQLTTPMGAQWKGTRAD